VTKRYVALARVSSREQEREGFSLDIQEDALRRYAERTGGTIVKLFRIARTSAKLNTRASGFPASTNRLWTVQPGTASKRCWAVRSTARMN